MEILELGWAFLHQVVLFAEILLHVEEIGQIDSRHLYKLVVTLADAEPLLLLAKYTSTTTYGSGWCTALSLRNAQTMKSA